MSKILFTNEEGEWRDAEPGEAIRAYPGLNKEKYKILVKVERLPMPEIFPGYKILTINNNWRFACCPCKYNSFRVWDEEGRHLELMTSDIAKIYDHWNKVIWERG